MRVISGTARGRKLKPLPGLDTRPTTDRVKESIFNIIQFDIEGRQVLDLFAGSGQMGIEALSRGAAHVTFVEQSPAALAVLRENLAHTGFQGNATVAARDALAFVAGSAGKFDLIFLDPPYGSGLLAKSIAAITAIDIVSKNGIMVCESSIDEVLPDLSAPYRVGREYRYGKVKITLCHREGDA